MMKNIRDWAFSQLISNTWSVSRSITGSGGFSSEEPCNEEHSVAGNSGPTAIMRVSQMPSDVSTSSNSPRESFRPAAEPVAVEETSFPQHKSDSNKMDPMSKIEALKIKFVRLLNRLGQSQEDLLVAKVLYRLYLASLIRAGESDLKRINLKSDRARTIASDQEAADQEELDFSLRILALGKTGVGKSATINSIFDQAKAVTNAFHPATNEIQEVVGSISGFTVKVVDTPGLLPFSVGNMRRNRKILRAIRRHVRRSPPDVVFYFERLDLINTDYSDLALVKLITEVFGSSMWFNTILVMTHAASARPEGPTGSPVTYESYVARRKSQLQRCIYQAVVDSKLENPCVLVENHLNCRTNTMGEKLLPNGEVWKSNLMLLCVCTKVLGDANAILGLHNSIELGPSTGARHPSLPHLLSSLLRQRSNMGLDGPEDEFEGPLFSEEGEDVDEYDQLPPIKILSKSQFENLRKSQKREYLDELDYRETLFLKKQLKEELIRRKENNLLEEKSLCNSGESDINQGSSTEEAFPLPDMAIPPSFDSDCPLHRYHCVVTQDQLIWRPVLDPHGWDHDVGFDGVNVENSVKLKKNMTVHVAGQMSKEKHDFSIHSECSAFYADLARHMSGSMGLDVQSAGKEIIYSVHGDAKLRSSKASNVVGCGLSLTSFQDKPFFGAKVEDALLIGKRVRLMVNAGRVEGAGESACGGSLEATVTGRDYPVRREKLKMAMTAVSYNKETVVGGSLESEFRPHRGVQVTFGAKLNNQKMGQVQIKVSSSECSEFIGMLAVISVLRSLARRKEVIEP